METLYLLIPLSVVLVFLIGIAFWWSLRNGQFEDLEGPGYRLLMDDDRIHPSMADTEPHVAVSPDSDDQPVVLSEPATSVTKPRDT
ncbi:MAG TPA: cbb3-type cytochrome oxidase assembly protein CcoS [Accumulibacter sp.]|nr:cbb3-type cytochrome oxidase assembly protein CcoS [Accumulibacter sp.]HMW16365.1 cbb3-type cytochrome oxidase assembly protein CcoS [Accumulibacter sp.]HMX22232.1 cbb3-type cytochrome oxidase assembly protein CcoS [Accumulibacter sp.]HMY07695.1 cbb3-type cytochrome oxidase assembly protein CcoS [Accumulibacter sp.]HNC17376.1 cbb3-type cytochrome oxidase assembly protein CcoS [Accumulibacter sp.]